jgi:transcriptional regulator of acetoin/glycerol metabolism
MTRLAADLTLADAVRKHVLAALAECGGRRNEAAKRLGISRHTLYRLLAQFQKESTKL